MFYKNACSLQSIILKETAFAYTLRPYQIDGVKWMLNIKQWTSGCLLADEMGLQNNSSYVLRRNSRY